MKNAKDTPFNAGLSRLLYQVAQRRRVVWLIGNDVLLSSSPQSAAGDSGDLEYLRERRAGDRLRDLEYRGMMNFRDLLPVYGGTPIFWSTSGPRF